MWKRPRKQIELFHAPRICRAGALIFSVSILTTFIILTYKNKRASIYPSDSQHLKWNSFWSSLQFQPTVEFVNGTDIIWQIPNSPKAVLFLAHGCNGRAANFWDRSPSCQNCVGLPEERLIVLQALHQKYAVLTISSVGTCWSFGDEERRVRRIIQWWVGKHKIEKLPILALGASSGFSSIVLMIAEGLFDFMDIPSDYPPTLFVHMPKDRIRKLQIKRSMESLRNMGVPVDEIECKGFPLTPKFLSDRIPSLDETFSVKLFELFREKGFIDENNYMKSDGRGTQWKEAVKEIEPSADDHEWTDHVQEELNLAFGYHEMTSLQMEDIIRWFESHLSVT
ncbi:unnamed protein product [Spirodela intermedia]|uniref:Uncharacterized protein n=1 Tax=Spirodela intermedia TaxID=51605 RepID=A0A7I8J6N2_SPIIN|nr:unnamed protein product [Spirodela intermedia]CAA6665704.1 unnamed protein product [Spirodela intermedia]